MNGRKYRSTLITLFQIFYKFQQFKIITQKHIGEGKGWKWKTTNKRKNVKRIWTILWNVIRLCNWILHTTIIIFYTFDYNAGIKFFHKEFGPSNEVNSQKMHSLRLSLAFLMVSFSTRHCTMTQYFSFNKFFICNDLYPLSSCYDFIVLQMTHLNMYRWRWIRTSIELLKFIVRNWKRLLKRGKNVSSSNASKKIRSNMMIRTIHQILDKYPVSMHRALCSGDTWIEDGKQTTLF